MNAVELHGVSKRFGRQPAVSDLSFDVPRGSAFGFLGPNGAGKTTTLRMIADVYKPDAGTIQVLGGEPGEQARRRIGYLPEERGLYQRMRVDDQLRFFAELNGVPQATAEGRISGWLERLEVGETRAKRVQQLSKGTQQKIQFIAAVLHEPELLILDEPFSGLDPVNTALVRDLIGEVRASGRTTILSTHQMSMVETLCDRVALLSEGKRVVYGEVNEVRRRYSAAELRVSIAGELPELPEVERVITERPGTHRLMLADGADPQRVLAGLVAAGVDIERYERVLASMEDIFIRVVKHGEDRG